MVAVVYRHADAHLTRADHIDTGLVCLEYLEDLTEETISEEHSAAVYLDADVAIASCNCLNDTTLEVVIDDSTRSLRVHRVLQSNWNTCELSRLNAGRMQYLRAKVSKLSSLFEV